LAQTVNAPQGFLIEKLDFPCCRKLVACALALSFPS
jgi:hypothetical protein